MNEFERAMEKMSKSVRKSAIQSIREDERMRQNAREMLVHVARARVAAHGAASISLARTDQEAATATTAARRKSLQDISLVSGAAAKVALDRSVEHSKRERRRRESPAERAAREAAEADERKEQQPVFEHLEACTERVLRAELALAQRIAKGKQDFVHAARRDLRCAVEEMGEALLPEDEDVRRERDRQLLDSRPQVVDALLSGDGAEIEAAFEVLVGPLILYIRHYSNWFQMLPKILLIVIGLPIILEQDLKLGDSCKDVLMINGRPFLPMSAWLLTQIITDIAIVITRARRYFLMRPVVRAFDRGEGVEATKLRTTKRAELFTSFLKHNLMRVGGRARIKRRKEREREAEEKTAARSRRMSTRPGALTVNEQHLRGLETMLSSNLSHDDGDAESPRPPKAAATPAAPPAASASTRAQDFATRARSLSTESDAESEDEAAPPHALDAIIPIEEASERGERALLALARVENSGTRIPLALLTILSFVLGLAGGVYLLLPFGRDSCQPLALVLANSYIAFFYIFFVPNLLICAVAVIELTSTNPEDQRLRDVIEHFMSRLDDIFFLGQLPLCTFFAKRLLLKSTAPPLDGARLKALLRRDAYILNERRQTLSQALEDCDEQIAAVTSIRKRARLAFKRKDTLDPLTAAPSLRVRRYSRYVPEITWRQSFVPVYREVDPAAPLDSDPFLPTRNAGVSPIKLIGETFRLNNSPQGSSRSLGDAKRDSEDTAFFDAL